MNRSNTNRRGWLNPISLVVFALVWATLASLASAEPTPADVDAIKKSVVQLTVSKRSHSLTSPWKRGSTSSSGGTGVVISKGRVLTNAHVVRFAREIRVRRSGASRKFDATVVGVSHEMDLALLQIDDDAFQVSEEQYLQVAETLPRQQDQVYAYGFPIGGETVSVTEGIVSRVEYAQKNYFSYGFRIQVDAALNPGNSGGPAVVDGKLAGLVSSGLKSADNIGYLIASVEINRFLEDLKDGTCDGKKSFYPVSASMENQARRRYYRVDDSQQGRLITHLRQPADYPLKPGDVVTGINERPIDNDGKVRLDGLSLTVRGAAELLAVDDQVTFAVIRDGETMNVVAPLTYPQPPLLRELKGERASYFVYGPLVFTAGTSELCYSLQGIAGDSRTSTRQAGLALLLRMSRNNNPLLTRANEYQSFEGEEIVIVAKMLKHRSMRGNRSASLQAVKSVNDVPVRNLRHLAQVLKEMEQPLVRFQFDERESEPLIVAHEEMIKLTPDVMEENGITRMASEDLSDLWSDLD